MFASPEVINVLLLESRIDELERLRLQYALGLLDADAWPTVNGMAAFITRQHLTLLCLSARDWLAEARALATGARYDQYRAHDSEDRAWIGPTYDSAVGEAIYNCADHRAKDAGRADWLARPLSKLRRS